MNLTRLPGGTYFTARLGETVGHFVIVDNGREFALMPMQSVWGLKGRDLYDLAAMEDWFDSRFTIAIQVLGLAAPKKRRFFV